MVDDPEQIHVHWLHFKLSQGIPQSIVLNCVATLVFLEIDNCAFYVFIDERTRASHLTRPIDATPEDVVRIERSKRLHCIGAFYMTLLVPAIATKVSFFTTNLLVSILTVAIVPLYIVAEAQLVPMSCSNLADTALVAVTVFTLMNGLSIVVFFFTLGWM